jgi:hypothetical protein
MSIRIFNQHDKRKWNVAIHIDKQYDTWYSYRFKKYYCGESHGFEVKSICCFKTQQEYISHMLEVHNKPYNNPDFVLPAQPEHIIIVDDELILKGDNID